MLASDKPRRTISVALFEAKGAGRALSRTLAERDIHAGATPKGADVIVCDLRGRDETDINTQITRRREDAIDRPLIFLAGPDQLTLPALSDLARTDTVVLGSPGERALVAEIRRRGLELDRSSEAAIRVRALASMPLGGLPPHSAPAETSALLVAQPGPEILDLSSKLSAHVTLHTVMSRQHALSALELGVADRVFILASKLRRSIAAMVKLIRRHSELGAVPVIVFEENPTDRHRDYWSRAGADAVLSTKDVAFAAALAEQRRKARSSQHSALQLLRHLSFTEQGEPSRLSAPRYFESCLSLRCQTDMPFCLGAIRLSPHRRRDDAHVFTEPSIYVALGCLPTDLVTRSAPDLLLISMPGSDLHHARRTMRMLSTMVTDLKFGTQQSPVTFSTETNVVAAKPGVDARGMIRAVLAGLGAPTPVDALFA